MVRIFLNIVQSCCLLHLEKTTDEANLLFRFQNVQKKIFFNATRGDVQLLTITTVKKEKNLEQRFVHYNSLVGSNYWFPLDSSSFKVI
jgi:hypothetical protein